MSIAQPTCVTAEYGQDLTWTVSLDPATDITGWAISVAIRPYNGATALVTKTTVSGITITSPGTGVFVATFTAANMALTYGPGAYVIQAHRTDSGLSYPITDPSPLILRPADSTSYPTLTNLGEYSAHALQGITLTDEMSQQLIQLLFAAEQRVKTYCNRDFVYRATQTEYYDGNGQAKLRLRRTPVVASSVVIYEDWNGNYGQTTDSFDATNTVLTLGDDYSVRLDSKFADGLCYSGIVERIGTVWPFRHRREIGYLSRVREALPGCIKVVYSAGFMLIPHDLKRCVWDLTSIMESGSITGRQATSESSEGYSVSRGSNDDQEMPAHIRFVLDSYKGGQSIVR